MFSNVLLLQENPQLLNPVFRNRMHMNRAVNLTLLMASFPVAS